MDNIFIFNLRVIWYDRNYSLHFADEKLPLCPECSASLKACSSHFIQQVRMQVNSLIEKFTT